MAGTPLQWRWCNLSWKRWGRLFGIALDRRDRRRDDEVYLLDGACTVCVGDGARYSYVVPCALAVQPLVTCGCSWLPAADTLSSLPAVLGHTEAGSMSSSDVFEQRAAALQLAYQYQYVCPRSTFFVGRLTFSLGSYGSSNVATDEAHAMRLYQLVVSKAEVNDTVSGAALTGMALLLERVTPHGVRPDLARSFQLYVSLHLPPPRGCIPAAVASALTARDGLVGQVS